MNAFMEQALGEIKLPRFAKVRQHFADNAPAAGELPGILQEQLQAEHIARRLQPGMHVCITCGSRGIANLQQILKELVAYCHSRDTKPFIIPAMGSHGGATAEGQEAILTALGITEETVGCPIRATMETVVAGYTEDGHEVRIDQYAAEADAIIVVNRVKPHTAFRGTYESGLMKMMAIGLGKQKGAEACHADGFRYMAKLVPAYGRVILRQAPVICGIAIVENAFDKTAVLEVVAAEDIEVREPALLQEAFRLMPKILLPACDVLIVDEIGKNISGGGMDPNITGAFATPCASGGIAAQRRGILRLTEESHGSGYGMGAADAVSRKLFEALDLDTTYPNSITSTSMGFSKIPMILPNDMAVMQCCIRTCSGIDREHARVIRIKNTLQLETIQISEALLEEAEKTKDMEILAPPAELIFDAQGNLGI